MKRQEGAATCGPPAGSGAAGTSQKTSWKSKMVRPLCIAAVGSWSGPAMEQDDVARIVRTPTATQPPTPSPSSAPKRTSNDLIRDILCPLSGRRVDKTCRSRPQFRTTRLNQPKATPSGRQPAAIVDRGVRSDAPNEMRNGEGGIRTPGTGLTPFNGLANRRFKPLSHLSGVWRSVYSPRRSHDSAANPFIQRAYHYSGRGTSRSHWRPPGGQVGAASVLGCIAALAGLGNRHSRRLPEDRIEGAAAAWCEPGTNPLGNRRLPRPDAMSACAASPWSRNPI